MRENSIVKSPDNNYLLSRSTKMIMYLPDKLNDCINLGFENTGNNTEVDTYYLEKIKFLKKNGILSGQEYSVNINEDILSSEAIQHSFLTTNQIVFEVTDKCNLNCTYCCYGDLFGDHFKQEIGDMSYGKAKSFLKYFFSKRLQLDRYAQSKELYIGFYGGEPLMNFTLVKKIVSFIKSFDLPFEVIFSMTTNGTLLKKYYKYLVENDFYLNVSIDGFYKNNEYRCYKNQRNCHPEIIDGLKTLNLFSPKYYKAKVVLHSVLHNLNSVDEISKFAKSLNLRYTISSINHDGIQPDQVDRFNEMFKTVSSEFVNTSNELINENYFDIPEVRKFNTLLRKHSGIFYDSYKDLFVLDKKSEQNYITGTCIPFSRKVFITVEGNILPCERISQINQLGTIKGDSVHIDFNEVSNKYLNWFRKAAIICLRCRRIDSCKGCLFQSFDDEKSYCRNFEKQDKDVTILEPSFAFVEKNRDLLYKLIYELIIV